MVLDIVKGSLQDMKEMKELLQDIKKGKKLSHGGENSINLEKKR